MAKLLAGSVLVLALVAAACGGTVEIVAPPQETAAASVEAALGETLPLNFDTADETSRAVAVALVDVHGDEGGFVALVLALERGYDIHQVIDAATMGNIDAQGNIAADGDIVQPSGPRAGVIELPEQAEGEASAPFGAGDLEPALAVQSSTARIVLARSSDGYEASSLLAELQGSAAGERFAGEEAGKAFIAAIVSLAQSGYSLEQIVAGLFTDAPYMLLTDISTVSDDLPCGVLIGVRPARRDEAAPCSIYVNGAIADELDWGEEPEGDREEEKEGQESPETDNETDSTEDAPEEAEAEAADEPIATGSGHLLENPLFPGPHGTMMSESIVMTIDEPTAVLDIQVAYQTAVEYVNDAPDCWDNFTLTSDASNLTVDAATVSGTVELTVNYAGAAQCPEDQQDDIGVPYSADVSGLLDGSSFVGKLSFEGIALPFVAVVDVAVVG